MAMGEGHAEEKPTDALENKGKLTLEETRMSKYMDMAVIVTAEGDHFHLFADCRSLAQGRRNSVKFGRELSLEMDSIASDAIDDGYFACRTCHRVAGLELPIEADRKAIRASRKAGRARTAVEAQREANAKARIAAAKAKRLAAQADKAAAKATTFKRPETIEAKVAEAQALAAEHKEAKAEAKLLASKAVKADAKAELLELTALVYATNDSDKDRWDAAMGRRFLVIDPSPAVAAAAVGAII